MTEQQRCERCGEKLDLERAVFLELNQRTLTYHQEGEVPESESQGGFPFGRACARTVLAAGGVCERIRERRR